MSIPTALAIAVIMLASGCRHYDSYSPLADQEGLIPPAQWGQYGQEQAVALAIGQELGSAYESSDTEALARQMDQACLY